MKYLALAALFVLVTAVGPLADTSVSDLPAGDVAIAVIDKGCRRAVLEF